MVDMANEGLCKRRDSFTARRNLRLQRFFDFARWASNSKQYKAAWWNDFVHGRDDIVGLDASIIMAPDVWKASARRRILRPYG
ncbi:MAG: hypothetical protein ACLUKN_06835 [Bacilli bacterium]